VSDILSVTQLTQNVKDLVEANFPAVAVQGEISNFKPHTSGHLYFSLKDAGAQISAVMFRQDAQRLPRLPREGDQVVAHGGLNVYPPRGQYQMVVRSMEAVGLGELLLKLEQLKREIHRRGWFAAEHKRPLPKFPKRVGVITSPTGAVIQDIINIFRRRNLRFQLLLNPVKVQGEGAAAEIAKAIEQMNRHKLVDVMIVGRGGGSIEDLWAFNEEIVAKAIFESEIPIVCAVGHETDHTIAEYVADLRAPTPSAAAEMVMAERSQQEAFIDQCGRRLAQTMRHLIVQTHHRLNRFRAHPFYASPYALLEPWMQRLDDLTDLIDEAMKRQTREARMMVRNFGQRALLLAPTTQFAYYRKELSARRHAIDGAVLRRIKSQKERLNWIVGGLTSVDPKNLLAKGYSILFNEKDGSIINSTLQVESKQGIKALLSDGTLRLQVISSE
jgi:exodeoxyribonuclease VII large subunit